MKYKCVVLGDSGVGKSTLCHSLKLNRGYFPSTNPTIGAAFFEIKDKNYNKICIWDTAGQEKYSSLVPLYIRGCQIIIFVCSIDNRKSVESLSSWYNLASEYYPDGLPNCIFLINKIDLENDNLKILNSDNIEKDIKNKIGNYDILRCSGRLGKNISCIKNLLFSFYYEDREPPKSLLEEYINEEEEPKINEEYEYHNYNSCSYRKPLDKNWSCC